MTPSPNNPAPQIRNHFFPLSVKHLLAMLPSIWTSLSFLLPLCASTYLLFGSSVSAAPSQSAQLRVQPQPAKSRTGNTVLCLSDDFTIHVNPQAPHDLHQAVQRTTHRLRNDKHEYLSPRRGLEFFRSSDGRQVKECEHYLHELRLSFGLESEEELGKIASIFEDATRPVEDRLELEVYRLSVPVSGEAVLESHSAIGMLRGLTTFEQLFYHLPSHAGKSHAPAGGSQSGTGAYSVLSKPDSLSADQQLPLGSGGVSTSTDQADRPASSSSQTDGQTYAPLAPYEIEDKPAFPWRATGLDTSRNWNGPESLRRIFDTMSLVKLNVFHWHITDSNSWPLVLSEFPELAQYGAYSPAQVFTEETVKELVQYAGERGIDVLMEIDSPGHTAIIGESHPEHVACFERTPWVDYTIQPQAGQLRFSNPETTAFASKIFEGALRLTKSPYFGTGGDELKEQCMTEDEQFQAELAERGWTLNDALNEFTAHTHGTIRARGRTPVVWQEMVLKHGPMPSVGPDTIVDIWMNSTDARRVLDKGFRIVHVPADYFYLDCGQGGWLTQEGGGHSWCDPFKNWARMYSFNPYKDVTNEQKKLVLGGQTQLWAEQTDETNLEPTMWPRAAAVAELFWTGAGATGYPRSAIDAMPRINDVRYRMVARGIRAVPLQPHWCALRPNSCNWEVPSVEQSQAPQGEIAH